MSDQQSDLEKLVELRAKALAALDAADAGRRNSPDPAASHSEWDRCRSELRDGDELDYAAIAACNEYLALCERLRMETGGDASI